MRIPELTDIAHIFADAKTPLILHFHEVHDNQIDKYFAAAEAQEARLEQQDERITDQLYYELGASQERYKNVVAALNMCTRPRDLRNYVRPELKDKDGRVPARYITVAMAALFIPHLKNYKGKLSPRCPAASCGCYKRGLSAVQARRKWLSGGLPTA